MLSLDIAATLWWKGDIMDEASEQKSVLFT